MTTLELELAVFNQINIRQNLAVTNVSWGIPGLHECDILELSTSGYATEYELKISRSDLLKDKEKGHNHESNYIKYLYFVVPKHLKEIALNEIPERSGLMVVDEEINPYSKKKFYYHKIIKQPEPNDNCVKWSEKERYQLARLGTMRIRSLKDKLVNEMKKNTIKF